MPSALALLICTAVVLFLLWLERRISRGVSVAVWIPTLWMLIIGSRPVATWFIPSTEVFANGVTRNSESGSALDRIVLTGLALLAIGVLAQRRSNLAGTLRQHRWLLALLSYMFLSTFWSDITLIALKRWAREWIVVVMALLIVSEKNPCQALASVLRRSAYVLIPFSLMLIKYYPLLGRQYGRWSGMEMWTGVADQKNELGRLCMISIFVLAWALYHAWRERRAAGEHCHVWPDLFVAAIALYLLGGADSSTALGTLVVGVASFLGLRLFRKLNILVPQAGLLAVVLCLIAFGVSTPFLGGSNVAGFSTSLGRDETLTGRTVIWAAVLPAREVRPLLGFGLGSFWTDGRRRGYEIGNAHNGYFDILLELGEIGLAFYAVWLLSCARQLHRALSEDYKWASLAICVLLMVLVYNNTESALNSLTEYTTAVLILTSSIVSHKRMAFSNRLNSRSASESDAAATAAWHEPEPENLSNAWR